MKTLASLKTVALAVAATSMIATAANAAVMYTTSNSTYSQDFNSLTSGSWSNDSTLTGWSLFNKDSNALASIALADGSSNSGGFFSFASASASSDKALGGTGSGGSYFGSPASGNLAGYIALSITNSTGSSIDSFTLNYDGEQWRNGGNTSAHTMNVQYGFGSTFSTVSSWTNAASTFNFTSPITGSSASALDGNAAANRAAGLGGTVSDLTWANGDTLWLRWIEINDAGSDHALAIDNLTFSANAVPEPASLGLIGIAGLALARRRRAR